MPTLTEQAHKAALDQIKAEKPSQFTVGGYWDGQRLVGGITYDRKWSNVWGLTAYIKAYWDDLPVATDAPRLTAGVELTRKF